MNVKDIVAKVDYLKSSWETKTYSRKQLGLDHDTAISKDPSSAIISEDVFQNNVESLKKQLSSRSPEKAKPASFEMVGKEGKDE